MKIALSLRSTLRGAVLALLVASGSVQAESWSFGVLSQRSAVLSAEYWNPILDHVRARTGVELQLKLARTAPESNAAIERGEYDFVYSNTIFQPRLAPAGYQVILRPLDAAISGQIVTLATSPVQDLAGLQGHAVGFPSRAAFLGYAVPMDALLRREIQVEPVFGGNQEGIMGQLRAGRVIAAGVNSQVMQAFAAREGIQYRVLWESQPYHNLPIAVHPRVPATVAEAVKLAIDAMQREPAGQKVLAEAAAVIGQQPPYGFQASSPEEYRSYSEFYRDTLVKDIE